MNGASWPRRATAPAVIGCFLLLLSPVAVTAADCPAPQQLAQAELELISEAGTNRITVEVADSAPARAAGLMCREALAKGTGMLLVYPGPQDARIWMKNMRVPIDILFIAADGRVSKIVEQAQPGQQNRIKAGVPVTQVLELPAGDTRRYRLRVGDVIRRAQ